MQKPLHASTTVLSLINPAMGAAMFVRAFGRQSLTALSQKESI